MFADTPPFGLQLTPEPEYGRIEFQVKPPATYYITPAGARWRILDCVMTSGLLRRTALEADRAKIRVFIERSGAKRLYGRKPREVWKLSPAVCARQLAAASPSRDEFADGEEELVW